MKDLPVLLLLNKTDSQEFQTDFSPLELEFNLKANCKAPIEIRKVSALQMTGVKEAMEWVYEVVPKHQACPKEEDSQLTADELV